MTTQEELDNIAFGLNLTRDATDDHNSIDKIADSVIDVYKEKGDVSALKFFLDTGMDFSTAVQLANDKE